jgi:uncharacterized protein (DUF433 family)
MYLELLVSLNDRRSPIRDNDSAMKDITDLEWQSRINVDPRIMHGRPVIRGTRVLVEIVVGNLGGGASIEEICREYNLTVEDVRAALIFAAEVVAAKGRHALPAG